MDKQTLQEVLTEICYRQHTGKTFIEDVVADGRIGLLPTRDEVAKLRVHHTVHDMIREGWARENPKPTEREVLARRLYAIQNATMDWSEVSKNIQNAWLEQADRLIAVDIGIKETK